MWWNTAIILIWLCIFFTIVAVTIVCQKKKTGIAKPISIIFAGMLLAVYIGIFPRNYVSANYSDNDFIRFTETFFISIADLIQVFTANNNVKELLETIRSHESFFLQQAYIFTMSVLCTVAPLLTIGTLISILMRLSAGRRYLFSFFKTVYIFSDLNDRSIVLASDLKNKRPNSVIVFTNVEQEDETSEELLSKAKSIGAILFKQDILTPKFHMHRKKAEMLFFIMGDNEAENIEHSLILIERYKNRENTRLYIFSSTRESELALTGVDKGKLKVRRINEVQSLIYRTLYEKGEKLFDKAIENNGTKNINVVVLGMGNYGTEMVKALAWFCQMDGYKLTIHAFDKDPYAESKFKALCPDLMSDKYNGKTKPGETDYTMFDELLAKLQNELCIDSSRVFSTGFSYGSMFTNGLSRNHQHVLRGVAVYETADINIWLPEVENKPIAWMGVHGMNDGLCKPEMGKSARNTALKNASAEGKDATLEQPEEYYSSQHKCYDYKDVDERFPVRWCTDDAGHIWDHKDPGQWNSWVPAATWDFITQF